MHDQPTPTEEEKEEAATERKVEEDAMRYPGHDEDSGLPGSDPPAEPEPIHES